MYFRCLYDSVIIDSSGKKIEVSTGEFLKMKNEEGNLDFITVFDKKNNRAPIVLSLDDKKFVSETEIKNIKIKSQTLQKRSGYLIKDFEYRDKKYLVFQDDNLKLKLLYDKKEIEYDIKVFVESIDIFFYKIDNVDFVFIFCNSTECNYCIIFDDMTKFVYNGYITDYNIDESTITLLHKIENHHMHAKVTIIKVENKTLIVSDEYLAVDETVGLKNNNEIFLPYLFLDSMIVDDFDMAKKYIKENVELENYLLPFDDYVMDFTQNIFDPYQIITFFDYKTVQKLDFVIENDKISFIKITNL